MSHEGVSVTELTIGYAELNGGPALVATAGTRIMAVTTFEVDEAARIATIWSVANPDKLGAVRPPPGPEAG